MPHTPVTRADIPENLTTKATLLATLAAQLKFPDYFGTNWDAFEECICDLSWLQPGPVLMAHADVPLIGDVPNAITYVSILNEATRKMLRSEDHPLSVTFPLKHRDQVMWLLRARRTD
ncbi:barstar family protein [Bradyrhizobium sp. USDA 4454]